MLFVLTTTKELSSIGGVIVSVFYPSVVDHGLVIKLGQSKVYKTSVCCFYPKHTIYCRFVKSVRTC